MIEKIRENGEGGGEKNINLLVRFVAVGKQVECVCMCVCV